MNAEEVPEQPPDGPVRPVALGLQRGFLGGIRIVIFDRGDNPAMLLVGLATYGPAIVGTTAPDGSPRLM